MILLEEILSPIDKSLINLGNLSPSSKVICSLDDETISLFDKELDSLFVLSRGASRNFAMNKKISSRGGKDLHHEVQHENTASRGDKDLLREVQHRNIS